MHSHVHITSIHIYPLQSLFGNKIDYKVVFVESPVIVLTSSGNWTGVCGLPGSFSIHGSGPSLSSDRLMPLSTSHIHPAGHVPHMGSPSIFLQKPSWVRCLNSVIGSAKPLFYLLAHVRDLTSNLFAPLHTIPCHQCLHDFTPPLPMPTVMA